MPGGGVVEYRWCGQGRDALQRVTYGLLYFSSWASFTINTSTPRTDNTNKHDSQNTQRKLCTKLCTMGAGREWLEGPF